MEHEIIQDYIKARVRCELDSNLKGFRLLSKKEKDKAITVYILTLFSIDNIDNIKNISFLSDDNQVKVLYFE